MPPGPLSIMEKENDSGKPNRSFPGMFCDLFHTSLFQSFSLSPSENTYFSASRGPRDKVRKGKIISNQTQGNFGWAVTPSPTFQPPCVHARTPTQRAWPLRTAQAPDIGIQNFKQISLFLAQEGLCQLKREICKFF